MLLSNISGLNIERNFKTYYGYYGYGELYNNTFKQSSVTVSMQPYCCSFFSNLSFLFQTFSERMMFSMFQHMVLSMLIVTVSVSGRPFNPGEGWPLCGSRACEEHEIEVPKMCLSPLFFPAATICVSAIKAKRTQPALRCSHRMEAEVLRNRHLGQTSTINA